MFLFLAGYAFGAVSFLFVLSLCVAGKRGE